MSRVNRIVASVALMCAVFAGGQSVATTASITTGSDTPGGLVSRTQIITVTTLEDDGDGSPRWALRHTGPAALCCEVAGAIRLESDLRIRNPEVTIAGQTAPDTGITITGGALRINTH